jgi:hypothetical protein
MLPVAVAIMIDVVLVAAATISADAVIIVALVSKSGHHYLHPVRFLVAVVLAFSPVVTSAHVTW